jgi:phage regulator Rha-like protein
MNALMQPAQMMSSREISQLTGKQHDNVLKLVRSLVDSGVVKNTTPHQLPEVKYDLG